MATKLWVTESVDRKSHRSETYITLGNKHHQEVEQELVKKLGRKTQKSKGKFPDRDGQLQ